MPTTARIIKDSISPAGVRLTTFVVTFHRFILAELNTHRVFSRNSASSRAIPITKMIEKVQHDPALPIDFGSNKPGMQAGEPLEQEAQISARLRILDLRHDAIRAVYRLSDIGLHKQIANRYLEPFLWHTAIITATDFDNFFHQRCHKDAQPEMKALADAMQLEYYTHQPQLFEVTDDDWHLPFIDDSTITEIAYKVYNQGGNLAHDLKAVSVARCARVSYENHEGIRSIEDDLTLYDKLVHGSHWSPFEHIATPCKDDSSINIPCSLGGNFRGWHQFRKDFETENRTRFIPNLPELAEVAEKMRGDNE